MTLLDVLRARRNSLTMIRLALALLVLVSHAFPLSGLGGDPAWPTLVPATTWGGFAVGGFFALSGMLVTMSAMRNPPGVFVMARLLRILPAFLAVLVLTAFALGPVIYLLDRGGLDGYFTPSPGGPISYVLRNMWLPMGLQFGIHDLFVATTPYGQSTGASALNGSLWTLPVEVRAYVVAFLVVLLGRRLGNILATSLVALALAGTAAAAASIRPDILAFIAPELIPASMLPLLTVFLCGAVAGAVADRIPFDYRLVVPAAGFFVVASLVGGVTFTTVGLGSLAILLPALALLLPFDRVRWLRHDISYGTYVWAFPVQQTIAYAGGSENLAVFIVLSSVVTLVLATASWFLIEKPAVGLRDRLLGAPPGERPAPEVTTAPS